MGSRAKNREIKKVELIEKNYADEYERTGYFAAVNKGTLFAFAIDGKDSGSFTL